MPEMRTGTGQLQGLMRAYPAATRMLGAMVDGHLSKRVTRGKEDAGRLDERKGLAARSRPDGSLVWVHGASVGESLSVLPLIDRLLTMCPDVTVMITTGTVTSARLLAERLPPRAFHQFVPLDHPDYVARFLDHWQPDLALWVESEFWPNLLTHTAAQGVPLVLVNARISDKSWRNWQRFPSSIGSLLAQFTLCLAQDEEIARRLTTLGARAVRVPGNLKLSTPPLPADDGELSRLRAMIGVRSTWLAASVHDEEVDMLEAHRLLSALQPEILSIIAPRQPDLGPVIASMAKDRGLTAALRSAGDPITPETDLYIADTIGEMGLFFRLAPVAFMGRSFVPLGGSNPLEPARLDCAILHGPYTDNFRSVYGALLELGGTRCVGDAASLAESLHGLLNDSASRGALVNRAQSVVADADSVLDRVLKDLAPLLPSEARAHARA